MPSLVFVIIAALVAELTCSPADLKNHKSKKVAMQPIYTNQAHLLYEELQYIYSLQHGNGTAVRPKTLTPCARAILGCCKEGQMQEICSVDLGCGAYFFDDNPCDEKFVIDALNAAQAFYEQFVGKSRNG